MNQAYDDACNLARMVKQTVGAWEEVEEVGVDHRPNKDGKCPVVINVTKDTKRVRDYCNEYSSVPCVVEVRA